MTTDAGTISAEKTERFFNQPGYSPYAGRNFPTRPLWGEQHLHTSWSADAFGDGTRVGPDEAFRYAKGAEITSSTGQKVKLSRPNDWMVVADHSDAMGVVARVYDGDPAMMSDTTLREWHDKMREGGDAANEVRMEMMTV